MENCVYCDKPCAKYQDITSYNEHRICVDQKNQRYKDQVCVRCGKKDNNNKIQCNSCISMENAPWIGYVGPTNDKITC